MKEWRKVDIHNSFQMSLVKPLGLGIQLLTRFKGLFQIKMSISTWRKKAFSEQVRYVILTYLHSHNFHQSFVSLPIQYTECFLPELSHLSHSSKQKPTFKKNLLTSWLRKWEVPIFRWEAARYSSKKHKVQNYKATSFPQTHKQWGVSQKKFLHQTSQRRNLPCYLIYKSNY